MPPIGLQQALVARRTRQGGSATNNTPLTHYLPSGNPSYTPAPAAAPSQVLTYQGSPVSPTQLVSRLSVPDILNNPNRYLTSAGELRAKYLNTKARKAAEQEQQSGRGAINQLVNSLPAPSGEGFSDKGLRPAIRQLAPAAIKASRETGIPASVLLGVAGQESAYATNRNTSSAQARGVGQFIPSTGATYAAKGFKPFSYGEKGLEATGAYLKDIMAGNGGDLNAALSSYSGGYAEGAYNNPILQRAQAFSSLDKAKGNAGGGGKAPYVYPFGKQIEIGRTDMGIDPYGPGPIRAIGKAKYLGTGGEGWPTEGGTGTGPVYKLLEGPLKGKKIYTYEGITPADLNPGQKLKRGQVIAQSTGEDFETGFAQGRSAGFQPTAAPIYSEGMETPQGKEFRSFVDRLHDGGSVGGGLGNFTPASGTATGTMLGGSTSTSAPPMLPASTQRAASAQTFGLRDLLGGAGGAAQSSAGSALAARAPQPRTRQAQAQEQAPEDPSLSVYDLLARFGRVGR